MSFTTTAFIGCLICLLNAFLPHAHSSECGEMIQLGGDQLHVIEYSLNETLTDNLRCPWTIRFPESNQITFSLTQFNITPSRDDAFVHISTFSKDDKFEVRLEKIVLSQPTSEPVTLNGSLAIVILATEDISTGKGFSLEVQGNSVDSANISKSSVDRMFSIRADNCNYPIPNDDNGTEIFYDNNELTSFVFAPPNFTHGFDGYNEIYLPYHAKGLYGYCEDHLKFYNFAYYFGLGLDFRMCGQNGGVQWHTDMSIAIFSTDSENVGTGFDLSYYWT